MLTLYFSGTGNTEYLAQLFSRKMNAKCLSIEDTPRGTNFAAEIKTHSIIAFCYPVYCSRVPRIMREFVHKHISDLIGKKVIIFATQMMFSGDGARVFTDMFADGAIEIIYAEHFNMPINMGNTLIFDLLEPNDKSIQKCIQKTEAKINRVCNNIKNCVIKKRGFAKGSVLLGYIQGKPWQKNTKDITAQGLEKLVKNSVKIHSNCNACSICTKICPMGNLVECEGQVQQQNNCIACYRCVNYCPQKAITVLIHRKPRWQYKGMGKI